MTVRRQKGAALTRESWENLLSFLGPDSETAGRKYEEIRVRLIRVFACRGATEPEELADETINRVANKSGSLLDSYVGDPALYFLGVARLVLHESVRPDPVGLPIPEPDPWEEKETLDQCLELCMDKLTPKNRALILDYYRGEKGAKIDRRKQLAERLGIRLNALRIRAHRIRGNLQGCVSECVASNAAG